MACFGTMCLGRKVVRVVVIGGLAAGVTALVVGPERLHALVHQTQASIQNGIDGQITDPVALRSQIRELQAEYPERIGDVRSDLSELDRQGRELERELRVSRRVVEMADSDLDKIAMGRRLRLCRTRRWDGTWVLRLSSTVNR